MLNPENCKKVLSEILDVEVVNAVNGKFDTTEYSVKIKSELEKIKSNDKWRKEYMTLSLFERDVIRKGIAEEREIAIRRMLKKLSTEEIIELGYEEALVYKIINELDEKQ